MNLTLSVSLRYSFQSDAEKKKKKQTDHLTPLGKSYCTCIICSGHAHTKSSASTGSNYERSEEKSLSYLAQSDKNPYETDRTK